LRSSFDGLNDLDLSAELVELWFTVQLLKITGHAPNLKTDIENKSLLAEKKYLFDFDNMAFELQDRGQFTSNHIKLLRLAYGTESPEVLKQVKDAENFTAATLELAKSILTLHVRI